jgi:secreted trypsin-like serine protease
MLKIFLLFLALTALAVDGRYFSGDLIRTPSMDRIYDRQMSSRIVNGEPADIADFPHMLVLLDFTRGGFRCGASVIHPLWSLTAARKYPKLSKFIHF